MVTVDAAKSVTATFTDLPPTATILSLTVSKSNKAVRFTFTGNDPGNGKTGVTFKCHLDGKPFASCTSPTVYRPLKKGKHTVTVEAIDSKGNISMPVVRHFTF